MPNSYRRPKSSQRGSGLIPANLRRTPAPAPAPAPTGIKKIQKYVSDFVGKFWNTQGPARPRSRTPTEQRAAINAKVAEYEEIQKADYNRKYKTLGQDLEAIYTDDSTNYNLRGSIGRKVEPHIFKVDAEDDITERHRRFLKQHGLVEGGPLLDLKNPKIDSKTKLPVLDTFGNPQYHHLKHSDGTVWKDPLGRGRQTQIITEREIGVITNANECIIRPGLRCLDEDGYKEYATRWKEDYPSFHKDSIAIDEKSILKNMYTIVMHMKKGGNIISNDNEIERSLAYLDPDKKFIVHTPLHWCKTPNFESVRTTCPLAKINSKASKLPDEGLVGISYAVPPTIYNFNGLLQKLHDDTKLAPEEKLIKVSSVLLKVCECVKRLHYGGGSDPKSSIVHTQIDPELIHIIDDDHVMLKTHPKSMYVESLVRGFTEFTIDAEDLLHAPNFQYPPEAILALLAIEAFVRDEGKFKNLNFDKKTADIKLRVKLAMQAQAAINRKKTLYKKAKDTILKKTWTDLKLESIKYPIQNEDYLQLLKTMLGPREDIENLFEGLKQTSASSLVTLFIKLARLIDEYQVLILIFTAIYGLDLGHITRTFLNRDDKQKTMTVNAYLAKYLPRRKADINQIISVLETITTSGEPFYSPEDIESTTRKPYKRKSHRVSKSSPISSYDFIIGKRKPKTKKKLGFVDSLDSLDNSFVKVKLNSKEFEDDMLYGADARKYKSTMRPIVIRENKGITFKDIKKKYPGRVPGVF